MKASIEMFGETTEVVLEVKKYLAGGRPAITAMCEDGPFGVVTVNDPDVLLGPGEILVKAWTENRWVTQLLEQLPEHFTDTGRRVSMGHAMAHIWKFKP